VRNTNIIILVYTESINLTLNFVTTAGISAFHALANSKNGNSDNSGLVRVLYILFLHILKSLIQVRHFGIIARISVFYIPANFMDL